MSKNFRPWKTGGRQLRPPGVEDYVPDEHLSRLLVALVRERLDRSAITVSCRSGLGQPPFEPRLMTALLLHGYASGLCSPRRIARACVERTDFMMIAAGGPPDFGTISAFRRRHLEALRTLFVQVLRLAGKAGLVKLGHVALDGTRIRANASRHKAMSYERMTQREAELAGEAGGWLKAAGAEEDKLYGDKRGDELPDWVAGKQKRLEKIRGGQDRPGGGSQGRRRGADAAARGGGAAAQGARPQEERQEEPQDAGGAEIRTRRQDATQLHRFRKAAS